MEYIRRTCPVAPPSAAAKYRRFTYVVVMSENGLSIRRRRDNKLSEVTDRLDIEK